MFLCHRRAVTFIEIVIAVAILAIAMIPLFGLISRQTVETDKTASQAFAINKASEVLNTILDNVPFATIRQGNPGFIKIDDLGGNPRFARYNDTWARKLVPLLFPGTSKEGAGYPCRGIVTDSRGIHYLVHLRVEDVVSERKPQKPERIQVGDSFPDGTPKDFAESPEMSFTFLRNPALISDGSWIQDYAEDPTETAKPFSELDIGMGKGVSEAPGNVYLDQGMEGFDANAPRFINPTAERYTSKMVTEKVPYTAPEKFSWCTMKKLVVQVQWNIDQKYFTKPEENAGRVQRIHLMTIKGDIDG
ncbi:MAG TPA: hypothetical protein PLM07_06875 [Candidatus Rifleibacterium sp.]|nr:hypothetical protein [Candidatus Rifleibacterium sp.]HPT45605.1 hypothetical protein [Candidatus Rifleibacterium sp.]